MKDPFGSGFEHVLVPALQPEVGYFHVQRADAEGNSQMWGISGDAPWSVRACKKVIVSCEEIVSREIIGETPIEQSLRVIKLLPWLRRRSVPIPRIARDTMMWIGHS